MLKRRQQLARLIPDIACGLLGSFASVPLRGIQKGIYRDLPVRVIDADSYPQRRTFDCGGGSLRLAMSASIAELIGNSQGSKVRGIRSTSSGVQPKARAKSTYLNSRQGILSGS